MRFYKIIKPVNNCLLRRKFARALGFEPRSRVLETRMLAVAPCPQIKISLFLKKYFYGSKTRIKELIKKQSTQAISLSTLQRYNKASAKSSPMVKKSRSNLFYNLSNLAGTYGTTTFTNGEFQTFLHRNRLDKGNFDAGVITWHNHFSSFR